jgi:hypothetical protein
VLKSSHVVKFCSATPYDVHDKISGDRQNIFGWICLVDVPHPSAIKGRVEESSKQQQKPPLGIMGLVGRSMGLMGTRLLRSSMDMAREITSFISS